MKKMACFPPTPKYEISLFKDLGTSATLQKKEKKKNTVVYVNNVSQSNVLVSDSNINGSWIYSKEGNAWIKHKL